MTAAFHFLLKITNGEEQRSDANALNVKYNIYIKDIKNRNKKWERRIKGRKVMNNWRTGGLLILCADIISCLLSPQYFQSLFSLSEKVGLRKQDFPAVVWKMCIFRATECMISSTTHYCTTTFPSLICFFSINKYFNMCYY